MRTIDGNNGHVGAVIPYFLFPKITNKNQTKFFMEGESHRSTEVSKGRWKLKCWATT